MLSLSRSFYEIEPCSPKLEIQPIMLFLLRLINIDYSKDLSNCPEEVMLMRERFQSKLRSRSSPKYTLH